MDIISTITTERVLKALELCFRELEPHGCGGFTADDIAFRLRHPFSNLTEVLDELWRAKRIRPCGFSDEDETVTCWEVVR
jgi:hypothetical protein